MKHYLFLSIIIFVFTSFHHFSCGQSMPTKQELIEQLSQQYDTYKEPSITHRRFKHSDIQPLISRLTANPRFKVQQVGKSVEGRTIRMISLGTGKTQVLLWSQMHGDEPTATMAIFDILNLFSQKDGLEAWKEDLLSKVSLHFIPMLNPDGAEVYKRRNALDIDLNRDALRLQSPEAVILKTMRDSLNADFGFNLHDQSTLYTAGNSPHTATISFLAPAFNYEKDINEVRGRSMKLIAEMNELLQQYMPQKVGKYYDDFEPRAFGDNIQKWGTSLILIESGGYPADTEKQFIRKMNFLAMLASFHSIARKDYEAYTYEQYHQIPFNERLLQNVVLRSLTFEKNKKQYRTDLGIVYTEIGIDKDRDFYNEASINDLGDLSVFYGYKEVNCEGMTAEMGKVYPQKFGSWEEIQKLRPQDLYAEGYTSIVWEKGKPSKEFSSIGLNILLKENASTSLNGKKRDSTIRMGGNPDLVIRGQDGKVKYVLINGYVQEVGQPQAIPYALIYK